MHTYDVKIRFSENDGIVFTEVLKENVPASEVLLLQGLHGPGRVHILKVTGNIKVDGATERARLLDIYARGRETGRKMQLMQQIFGPAHVPLPEVVPGFEGHDFDEPKRTRVKRKTDESADTETLADAELLG